jgi:hypothetical protein
MSERTPIRGLSPAEERQVWLGIQLGRLMVSAELMMLAVERNDLEGAKRYIDLVREPIVEVVRLRDEQRAVAARAAKADV